MEDLGKTIPQPLSDFLDRLHVNALIGQPQERGEVTVIPVAELGARMGYGFGSGQAPAKEGADVAESSGGGGGAGGTGSVTPRGYIELSAKGARWVPIVDERRMALGGMILAGWILFWLLYTKRALAGTRD